MIMVTKLFGCLILGSNRKKAILSMIMVLKMMFGSKRQMEQLSLVSSLYINITDRILSLLFFFCDALSTSILLQGRFGPGLVSSQTLLSQKFVLGGRV